MAAAFPTRRGLSGMAAMLLHTRPTSITVTVMQQSTLAGSWTASAARMSLMATPAARTAVLGPLARYASTAAGDAAGGAAASGATSGTTNPSAARGGNTAAGSTTGSNNTGKAKRKVSRGLHGVNSSSNSSKEKANVPLFATVLKQFLKRVHPDLFATTPELKTVNERSLQILNGILHDVRSDDKPYPKGKTQRIEFYVRTATKGHFLRLPMELRTTGNDCRNVLGKTFEEAFKAIGLPHTFKWGDEYWQKAIPHRDADSDSDEEHDN